MAGRQQAELDSHQRAVAPAGLRRVRVLPAFRRRWPVRSMRPLNNQIQQMRSNLGADGERLAASPGRRSRLRARQPAARRADRSGAERLRTTIPLPGRGGEHRWPRNFFEQLFGGPGSMVAPEQDPNAAGSGGGSGYRTVCVRTCDGYFFPISFSTSQDRFRDDEVTCQRMCPAAEVALHSHRNPGEDMRQAVSNSGRLYSEMPNAFKYARTEWNAACSCKQAGEGELGQCGEGRSQYAAVGPRGYHRHRRARPADVGAARRQAAGRSSHRGAESRSEGFLRRLPSRRHQPRCGGEAPSPEPSG